jgi:hypothetical protein
VTVLLIWKLIGACVSERKDFKIIGAFVFYGFVVRGQVVSNAEGFPIFRRILQLPFSELLNS